MSRKEWEKRNYPVYVGKHYRDGWESAASPTHGDGMADHPNYNKAKFEGDVDAALSVVKSCLSHLYIAQMQKIVQEMDRRGFERPILVAPYKKDSKNMLARTAAAYLGEKLGLEVDTAIVEMPGKSRKKMEKLERVFNTPSYGGDVKKKAYIAVDDVITTGGTLSELRSYVDSNGGRFLFACVLSSPKGCSTMLNPEEKQIDRVYKNLGQQLANWVQNAKGISIETLTRAEAAFLSSRDGYEAISRARRSEHSPA